MSIYSVTIPALEFYYLHIMTLTFSSPAIVYFYFGSIAKLHFSTFFY